MKISCFTFCLLFFLYGSHAQSAFLHQFSGFQNENTIHLAFTIAGGITCMGIEIERSTDTTNFITIGTIPGVCGNGAEDVAYSFDDKAPLQNQDTHYRLLLGQVGYSEIIKVSFFDYSSGSYAFPNPAPDHVTIFYPNSIKAKLQFKLFDLSGKLLQSLPTEGGSIELDVSGIQSGIYLYQLINQGSIEYHGKIAIL